MPHGFSVARISVPRATGFEALFAPRLAGAQAPRLGFPGQAPRVNFPRPDATREALNIAGTGLGFAGLLAPFLKKAGPAPAAAKTGFGRFLGPALSALGLGLGTAEMVKAGQPTFGGMAKAFPSAVSLGAMAAGLPAAAPAAFAAAPFVVGSLVHRLAGGGRPGTPEGFVQPARTAEERLGQLAQIGGDAEAQKILQARPDLVPVWAEQKRNVQQWREDQRRAQEAFIRSGDFFSASA